MITKEMILSGIRQKKVCLVPDPNMDAGTVCKIGDNWFYFGGLQADEQSPEDYKKNRKIQEIADQLMETLSEIQTEFPDEYIYYELYLKEQLSDWLLKISYSWGEEESDQKFDTFEEARMEARMDALREAEEASKGFDCEVPLKFEETEDKFHISLFYSYDNTYCYYDVVKE